MEAIQVVSQLLAIVLVLMSVAIAFLEIRKRVRPAYNKEQLQGTIGSAAAGKTTSGLVSWLLILSGAAFLIMGIDDDMDGEALITGTALILLAILINGLSKAIDIWARSRTARA
jgi:hypothetical protein